MLNEHLFSPYLLFEEANDKGGGSASDDGGGDGGDGASSGGDTGDNLESIEDYKKALADARRDAAKYRTRSKEYKETKERLDKLEKGLKGIFGEGEDLDPEKLKNKTQSLESELKAERVKNAVTIQAISEGLDPDLTIAYLQNKGSLKDLDHSDSESVSAVVSKAAKDKPNLKTKAPDKVGDGDGDEGTQTQKNLNPIDAYRQKIGILPKNSK